MMANETITARCEVTNTGAREGEEVVQLYIRDLVGSVTRPVRELKGFQKITLKPGESRKISFTISTNELSFYNNDLQFVAEPGDFKVFIGADSRTQNEAGFILQ